MKIYQKILTLILFISITFLGTACPSSQKTIRKATELSAQMQIYGTKLIVANRESFQAQEITLAQFKTLNDGTEFYIKAVDVYRDAVKTAAEVIKNNPDGAKTTLDKLSLLFNDKVVDAFFKILEKLNVIPGANSETVKAIIAGIRLTILAITQLFAELQTEVEGGAQWA